MVSCFQKLVHTKPQKEENEVNRSLNPNDTFVRTLLCETKMTSSSIAQQVFFSRNNSFQSFAGLVSFKNANGNSFFGGFSWPTCNVENGGSLNIFLVAELNLYPDFADTHLKYSDSRIKPIISVRFFFVCVYEFHVN